MCGIAGYTVLDMPETSSDKIARMLGAIAHRGPDDQGVVLFPAATTPPQAFSTSASDARIRERLPDLGAAEGFAHRIAFAHCRYSIVDLSPGGHQPMWDLNRIACVSFNGEIYNYVELRAELEQAGHQFATHSDTEVLLAAYLQWGTAAFARMNGQWAVSLFDAQSGRVLLARDRLGKVPLYYTRHGRFLFWASEIKALMEVCGRGAFAIRARAVHEFTTEGWRDRDGTFWEGVEDFPPASWAWIEADGSMRHELYWRLSGTRLRESDIGPEDAASRLRELLTDAIRVRVRADVPVAFELSGGMDSSTLVGLAAHGLPGRHKAYCIDFAEAESNETAFAQAVAQHHGAAVNLELIRPGEADFWRHANSFVQLEEEPFHAPSLFTNQTLRRSMKDRGARVVISGAAGDEVLAGYGEYLGPFAWHLLQRGQLPTMIRELRANTEFTCNARSVVSTLAQTLVPAYARARSRRRSGEMSVLAAVYHPPAGAKIGAYEPADFEDRLRSHMRRTKMNYWLRSANKANFGIPIEPRAPFLDYRVVDFAFGLPVTYLIRDGWHKWILRRAMQDLLPKDVVWRRTKMGFPFPLSTWLTTSRPVVFSALRAADCPYLNLPALEQQYEALVAIAPFTLWRLVSLALWWHRVVRGETLAVQMEETC